MQQKINIKIRKRVREQKVEDGATNHSYDLVCRQIKPILVNDKRGLVFVLGIDSSNENEDSGMGFLALNSISKGEGIVHFLKALNPSTQEIIDAMRLIKEEAISCTGRTEKIINK